MEAKVIWKNRLAFQTGSACKTPVVKINQKKVETLSCCRLHTMKNKHTQLVRVWVFLFVDFLFYFVFISSMCLVVSFFFLLTCVTGGLCSLCSLTLCWFICSHFCGSPVVILFSYKSHLCSCACSPGPCLVLVFLIYSSWFVLIFVNSVIFFLDFPLPIFCCMLFGFHAFDILSKLALSCTTCLYVSCDLVPFCLNMTPTASGRKNRTYGFC